MIEPVDETSEMEFAMPAGWETELERSDEVVSKDRASNQSENQAEVLKLYIVASSEKLDPEQPTGGGLAVEKEAKN